MGITIHWIDVKDQTLQSYILRLQNLYKRHSGIYLNTILIEVLKEFNIQNNIFCITRDNATNNDILIQEFQQYNRDNNGLFYKDIRYLAHIINLIVQDILREINDEATKNELIEIKNNANNVNKDEEIDYSNNKRKR